MVKVTYVEDNVFKKVEAESREKFKEENPDKVIIMVERFRSL